MAIAADNSGDLYIDGKLVPGGSGRYPTIKQPQEVLGTAADSDRRHGARHQGRRRAFDTTDWSTDTELAVRYIAPLHLRCHEGEHRGTARADHRRGQCAPDTDRDGSNSRGRSTTCPSAPTPPRPRVAAGPRIASR